MMYVYSWVFAVLYSCLLSVILAITSVHVTLPGNVPAPSNVGVIDGHNLTLTCHTNNPNSTLRWSKVGDPTFYVSSAILTLKSIRIDQRGVYTCDALSENDISHSITLDVNVLWGPHGVRVDGPKTALNGEDVVLNCSSSANPEPSYLWSYSPDGVPIVGRGQTFQEPNFPANYIFYCIVENTLLPTQGASVKTSASSWKRVQANLPAHDIRMEDDYFVNEGSMFDQYCKPHGSPTPIVWWTKFGDHTSINVGPRLIVPNIQRNFDGYYTCHAENNVTNAAGITQMVYTSKNTYIHVTPKGSTNQTLESCPTTCSAVTNGTADDKTTEKVCGDAMIAALAVGWILVAILLVIVFYFFIRSRNSHTPLWSKHHQSNDAVEITADSSSAPCAPRRPQELPRRPEEGGGYQRTYLSLRQSTIDRGNPDGSNLPVDELKEPSDGYLPLDELNGQNDGYLTPKSKHGPTDGYVEGKITVPSEKEDPSHGDNNAEHTYDVCA